MEMTTQVNLAPDVAEKLDEQAADSGRAADELANAILRRELENGIYPESPFEGQNAFDGLQEFIGAFNSSTVDRSSIRKGEDPYEQAFGEIIEEEYRNQGLRL
jgi:hypothetical protein